eukprot:tig00001025_g6361.t1
MRVCGVRAPRRSLPRRTSDNRQPRAQVGRRRADCLHRRRRTTHRARATLCNISPVDPVAVSWSRGRTHARETTARERVLRRSFPLAVLELSGAPSRRSPRRDPHAKRLRSCALFWRAGPPDLCGPTATGTGKRSSFLGAAAATDGSARLPPARSGARDLAWRTLWAAALLCASLFPRVRMRGGR